MLTGNVLVYAVGLPWLAIDQDLGFTDTMTAGLAPFIPGDLLKLYLAAALLPGAWRLVARLKG
jgi:biotin transport system substrate-specific component